MDFAKLALYQATVGAERPALAYTGGVATYGVLAGATAIAAARIRQLSLGSGHVAAVDVRNPFQHLVLLLALALEGVASVSVQNSYAIALSGFQVDALLADRFAVPAPGLNIIPVDDAWFDHDPKRPPNFAQLLAAPGIAQPGAVLRVVFSSGTTGRPKPVAIAADVFGRRLANGSFTYGGASLAGSRVMSLMGFSTLPAFMSAFGTLAGGGVICFAPSPPEALHLMNLFQVGLVSMTPHQLRNLLAAQGHAAPPTSLHTIVLGGAKFPPAMVAEARAKLCSNLMLGYGTTEAGSISHVHASAVEGVPDAAGRVLPWVTLEIVDDAGMPLPAGMSGRIRVRSNEMASYLGTHLTDIQPINDWFYPGDIGSLQPDGMLVVSGRSTEMINRGGGIIAPDLVEEVLLAAPGVADAAAVGMTNDAGLEEIWAAVVVGTGFDPTEALRFCQLRLSDRAPERLIPIDVVPRNDMGKIIREDVRQFLRGATISQICHPA
jgi:acyl-CoA synthetase (AMP-forming)/AMP-acid ligase II